LEDGDKWWEKETEREREREREREKRERKAVLISLFYKISL
jgi:hypothetical protein